MEFGAKGGSHDGPREAAAEALKGARKVRTEGQEESERQRGRARAFSLCVLGRARVRGGGVSTTR